MKTFAAHVRPSTLDQIIGQSHIVPFLKKVVFSRTQISLLLYGRPGIGKTSLAYAFCNDLKVDYAYFNAAIGTKKELQELIKLNNYLIVDEIHRLNKDKQDILLPALELGHVRLVATTTENPFFVVNPAVRSRLHLLELYDLKAQELLQGLKTIIKRENLSINLTNLQLKQIAQNANGDYRYALKILYLIHKLYPNHMLTSKEFNSLMPSLNFKSDRQGDEHYDLLSAFHKSLRGSSVDGSLFYLAKLIASGDLIGLERRMLMVAYEDVGLAAPNVALRVATAIDVAKKVGFPEGRIPLANAVIDLAKAPKSNSAYLAIEAAIKCNKLQNYNLPNHLKDSHYRSAQKLGRGQGYKYPHNYGGYVKQQYLPTKISKLVFYQKNKNDKL